MDVLDGQERTLVDAITAIVPVREMAISVAFYERLGFVSRPYEDGRGYVFMARDGMEFHLNLVEASEWKGNLSAVYFYVSDVDLFYDELVAAGVDTLGAPEDKPWRMREFAVSDPDGTLLRIGMRTQPR